MRLRRLSTDSIELALEQLIRARTSGAKASIKPSFVIMALKEILDRRRDEKFLMSSIDECFGDIVISDSDPDVYSEVTSSMVDEVTDLDELEEYCPWIPDWDKIEEVEIPDGLIEVKIPEPEPEESPRRKKPLPRTNGVYVRESWQNDPNARWQVTLLLVGIVVFCILVMLYMAS